MRFARARQQRSLVEITLTPLIDLFLNILIFFLVTTTFASNSLLYVDLPEARPGEKEGKMRQISISVTREGDLALDDRPVTLMQLGESLRAVPQDERAAVPVIIRADRGALHGVVVSVIDEVREAGMRNVGILTRSLSEEMR